MACEPGSCSALAELLGTALTPERFISAYFDRQSVLLKQSARAQPAKPVLTLDEMDELLVRSSLPASPSELIIFQDLRPAAEYATPHIAYASGASLIINRVDKVWPAVHNLCVRLANDFRYSYANVYLTPPDSRTVPPHSDDHDVFILQLHGRKHWLVWPTDHPRAQRQPFADEQAGKDGLNLPVEKLTMAELGPPELDALLEPGDVLYIPRGVLHVADTNACHVASTASTTGRGATASAYKAEPVGSLHLTIAIPTADLSYSSTLLHAVRAACFDERPFRQALPMGPLPTATPLASPLAPPLAPPPALPLAPAHTAPPSPSRFSPESSRAVPPNECGTSLCLAPADATSVRVLLSFGLASPARSGPPCSALSPRGALGAWRDQFKSLWAVVHGEAAAATASVRTELDRRLHAQRRKQREAFDRSEAAFASLVASSGGGTVAGAAAVCAATRLTKLVPLQLLTPEPEWPVHDLRRVAQAMPLPGGPGRVTYIHTPPGLFEPLEAFAAMPIGRSFALAELPASDDLLRACAARSLFALGVASSSENEMMR